MNNCEFWFCSLHILRYVCFQNDPVELCSGQPVDGLHSGDVRPAGPGAGRGPERGGRLLVFCGPHAAHHLRELAAGQRYGQTAGTQSALAQV